MRRWQPPEPTFGYVVDVQFHNSYEVVSIPCASLKKANREAMLACAEAAEPKVLGVSAVAIYSAGLVEHAQNARRRGARVLPA
jgi:hypothetical protein